MDTTVLLQWYVYFMTHILPTKPEIVKSLCDTMPTEGLSPYSSIYRLMLRFRVAKLHVPE